MPPKLLNDEGDLLTLRPMSLSSEDDLASFCAGPWPIRLSHVICAAAKMACNASRSNVLVADWEETYPGRKESIFRALTTIRPGHLLDPELFDFAGLG